MSEQGNKERILEFLKKELDVQRKYVQQNKEWRSIQAKYSEMYYLHNGQMRESMAMCIGLRKAIRNIQAISLNQ